jgi:hypothetical protein
VGDDGEEVAGSVVIVGRVLRRVRVGATGPWSLRSFTSFRMTTLRLGRRRFVQDDNFLKNDDKEERPSPALFFSSVPCFVKALLHAFLGIPRALQLAHVDDLADVVGVVGADVSDGGRQLCQLLVVGGFD